MKLTQQQVDDLLTKYDKLIWMTVHRFRSRNACLGIGTDDLHSECIVAYMEHIKKAKNMEEIERFPFRDMVHAMCSFILGNQLVSFPKKCTNQYQKFMKICEERGSGIPIDNVNVERSEQTEDVLASVIFRQFYSQLSPKEKLIVRGKLRNETSIAIAAQLGMSETQVSRMLSEMRTKYHRFAA